MPTAKQSLLETFNNHIERIESIQQSLESIPFNATLEKSDPNYYAHLAGSYSAYSAILKHEIQKIKSELNSL